MDSAIRSIHALFTAPPPDLWAASEALAREIGWRPLLASAHDLLKSHDAKPLWPATIEVITCGAGHTDALPQDLHEFIARIHFCADQCEALATVEMDEQIWAFVSTWLGLPYTSDWSPYSDPDISGRIARMHHEAQTRPQAAP